MKVLLAQPYFVPAWLYGGPVKATYEIGRRLVQRGHEVTVYTTNAMGAGKIDVAPNRAVEVEGMRTYYFDNVGSRYALFVSPHLIWRAHRDMAQFEVVHLTCCYTFQNQVLHRLAAREGTPYVLTPQGSLDPSRQANRATIKSLYFRWLERPVVRNASMLTALTGEEKRELLGLGVPAGRVAIVPNAVEPAEFAHLPPRGLLRQRLGIGAAEKVVLFLGRLQRIKGVDLLVRAFAGVAARCPEARLVLAGPEEEADYVAALRQLVDQLGLAQRVSLVGMLTGTDKLAALADADLFALTSRSEGLSLAVLEAGAAGLPLVLTRGCHFPEAAQHHAGLEVDYDVAAVEEALLTILTDDVRRRQMGERARDLVMAGYTWDRVVDRLESVYERAVVGPSEAEPWEVEVAGSTRRSDE